MKWVSLAALALLMAVGCSDGTSEGSERTGSLVADTVRLPDGRTVTCVYVSDRGRSGNGGVTCDWNSVP